jgi:putative N-acetylmannosamine-6-phosphate epimerase
MGFLLNNDSALAIKGHLVLAPLKNGLVVSCQVPDDTAINTPEFIAAQALTVLQAGAVGIRAQGVINVRAISLATNVPIIGLVKRYENSSPVYITPSVSDVIELEKAGAQIVAVDATERMRPGDQSFADFVTQVRLETGVVLLADVDSLESALIAESLGCEAIATTLSGYTEIPAPPLPNIKLIEQIANRVSIPIIAEGGFSQPQSVKDAFSAGAWSVCIGTAITNPYLLTKHFLTAIN